MYVHVLGERNRIRLIVLKWWESGESEDLGTLHGEGTAARLRALVEIIVRIIIQTSQKGPSVRKSSTLG